MIDIEGCTKLLNEVELIFNTKAIKYNGLNIWPMVRIWAIVQYTQEKILVDEAKDSRLVNRKSLSKSGKMFATPKIWIKKNKLVYLFLNAIRKNGLVVRKKLRSIRNKMADSKNNSEAKESYAIFLTHAECRQKTDLGYIDVFCDPMVDRLSSLGRSSLVLEFSNEEKYNFPRYNKSLIIENISQMKWATDVQDEMTENQDIKYLDEVLGGIKRYIAKRNIEFARFFPNASTAIHNTNKVLDKCTFFTRILGKVKPKIAFVVTYYNPIGFAFVLACKRMGIRVVDIQHGLQGDFHVSYGRWVDIPENGYELLPNIFWNWSKEDVRAIEKWSKQTNIHQSILGGNLWHNYCKKNNAVLSNSAIEIECIRRKNVGSIFVLVSLQSEQQVPTWITDLIESSSNKWIWMLRLHPTRMGNREKIKSQIGCWQAVNVYLDLSTDAVLPMLLPQMDVHLTANSSVVIEAGMFGICSVCTDPNAIRYFPSQFESGLALLSKKHPVNLFEALEVQTRKTSNLTAQGKTDTGINKFDELVR